MLWHIFENGWEDKEFIRQRVYGMDEIRAEVAKWNPEEVERVTGVPGEQLKRVAQIFATQKPATLIWCMGATQKTVGTANVRAYSHPAAGDRQCRRRRHRRQHLPRPYQRAGRHRHRPRCDDAARLLRAGRECLAALGRVWEVDYDWLQSAASLSKELMETPGIPTTRWFDAVRAGERKDRADGETYVAQPTA